MRSACARDQREGATCSTVRYLHTYLGSLHVRHLHLTCANARKDQFENLEFSQLSPRVSIPRARSTTIILSLALQQRRINDDPSICPPPISSSAIICHTASPSVCVCQRAWPVNQFIPIEQPSPLFNPAEDLHKSA